MMSFKQKQSAASLWRMVITAATLRNRIQVNCTWAVDLTALQRAAEVDIHFAARPEGFAWYWQRAEGARRKEVCM
jgi:hypothetical protein